MGIEFNLRKFKIKGENKINISFDSTELIKELEKDINEFGKKKMLVVWIKNFPLFGKEFIVNYDFFDESDPPTKKELKTDERFAFMQADVLLSELKEQNNLF